MAFRVLFVDDCPDAVALLPELSTPDVLIESCVSAQQARERLRPGHGYRAAVIDWVLGECSGLDLAHWLRSHSDCLPVVMVSAAPLDRFAALEAACVAMPAARAVRKPYDVGEVLALCRALAAAQEAAP